MKSDRLFPSTTYSDSTSQAESSVLESMCSSWSSHQCWKITAGDINKKIRKQNFLVTDHELILMMREWVIKAYIYIYIYIYCTANFI